MGVNIMAKRSKRYQKEFEKVDRSKVYDPESALNGVKETASASFDETVELAIKLGIDPKNSDQQVRGALVLPNGTGKEVKVVVFAQGEKQKEAEEAGADVVGGEELAERIEDGWLDFDVVVATPDMMKVVGPLGRILGPQGLMPTPKVGTVTFELEKAIKDLKAGQIEYRADSNANLHLPLGKVSFDLEDLKENLAAVMQELQDVRPAAAKGRYFRTVVLSSTMGPGFKVDPNLISDFIEEVMLSV